MAIFKFNYNKEGPGIDKNAPEKNIFLTYLELYKRKFWSLIKVNLLYFAASIPMMLILGVLFTMYLYPHLSTMIAELAGAAESVEASQAEATYLGVFAGLFIFEMLFMIGSGPASASFAYAARKMTNEEHLWIWGDFKDKFIQNFKQSIIVCVIDIVLILLIFNAAAVYLSLYKSNGSTLYLILLVAILIFAVVFVLMHGYLYQMIVTFENKLTVLYKNSFILAIAKLPQNLLLLLVPMILSYFLFSVLTPVATVILSALIWYATMRLPMEFYAARTLKAIIEEKSQTVEEKGLEE